MRKELPQRLLKELLKNSKRSDRELAKILKVSQPTITRARHKLEKDGMIEDYTIIPDFKKMGFEIMAVVLVKMCPGATTPETIEKAKKYTAQCPNTIFTAMGEGIGSNAIAIYFFKDYTEYHRRMNQLRVDWKDYLSEIQGFIVPIGEGEFKRFSLSHLKDAPL